MTRPTVSDVRWLPVIREHREQQVVGLRHGDAAGQVFRAARGPRFEAVRERRRGRITVADRCRYRGAGLEYGARAEIEAWFDEHSSAAAKESFLQEVEVSTVSGRSEYVSKPRPRVSCQGR